MPLHPAWLKNICRRVLWAAFENDITRIERAMMFEYFGGHCAYCGDELTAKWHADHLVSVGRGGFHHHSNRVPSCPRCNEDEKQERERQEFLNCKCGTDTALLNERKKTITDWRDRHLPLVPPVTKAQRSAWQKEVNDLATAIDDAWKRLRSLRNL